jgi:hypothetical protein
MLDVKILKLMFKEEFRLHISFFNRSFFHVTACLWAVGHRHGFK